MADDNLISGDFIYIEESEEEDVLVSKILFLKRYIQHINQCISSKFYVE